MAKKVLTEEEKKLRKLRKLSTDYAAVNEELQLSDMNTVNEQIHALVSAASHIQGLICKSADKIKIDDYDRVSELTQIDKSTYLDFVRVASLKSVDKLKEKAIAKFETDFENRLLQTNLRKTFLDTYISGDELKITDDDNREFEQFGSYMSDEFNKILEESAETRIYINMVLRRKYKQLTNAAMYVTELAMTPKQFKQLVDWEHYADGGYPTETSPSKLWDIFRKFNEAVKLLNKYEYGSVVDEHCWEFGLGVTEIIEHPKVHPWMAAESIEE